MESSWPRTLGVFALGGLLELVVEGRVVLLAALVRLLVRTQDHLFYWKHTTGTQ